MYQFKSIKHKLPTLNKTAATTVHRNNSWILVQFFLELKNLNYKDLLQKNKTNKEQNK